MIYRMSLLLICASLAFAITKPTKYLPSVDKLMDDLVMDIPQELGPAVIEKLTGIHEAVEIFSHGETPSEENIKQAIVHYFETSKSHGYSLMESIKRLSFSDKHSLAREFESMCHGTVLFLCNKVKRILDRPQYNGEIAHLNLSDAGLKVEYMPRSIKMAKILKTCYIIAGNEDICDDTANWYTYQGAEDDDDQRHHENDDSVKL